ncbi:MAG TPA: ornithine carbamoyltransferase [Geminicoccaceae bacterium]|nr:ornithine carbamoyltransferase [Geminicoccus sp.]HMU52762.1 ornithine carbamoyltransferase [Geminicoccaceae bacterium]
MAPSLLNRSYVTVHGFDRGETLTLLDLAVALREEKRRRCETPRLSGRNVCLVFEKTSTRTRCAFEVAAYDQGARVTYLDPAGSHLGHKESVKDTARVLGRMYDAIEYRGYSQALVEELAAHAGVPVYNGLSDDWHPTQMLADLMTMRERGPLERTSFAYLGDTRSNMGNSLMVAGCLMGMDVRLCGPRELWPEAGHRELAARLARDSGARLTITDDTGQAVDGVDFVHTDVWVSLGEPMETWADRIRLLLPYRVDAGLMARTGNPAAKFMHCLPAFHDLGTRIGREIHERFGLTELEVTDEVFESPASVVFDQAENRLHTIKALMVATLAG